MTDISRRLQRVIAKTQKTLINKDQILPQKVEGGILVGDVLISSEGNIKNLWQNGELKYREIYLNSAAIKIANLLALRKYGTIDELYRADQDYGRCFVDSQILRTQYQRATNNKDFERADTYWARYVESRDRAQQAKSRAEALAAF
jgi:hypothetical protein